MSFYPPNNNDPTKPPPIQGPPPLQGPPPPADEWQKPAQAQSGKQRFPCPNCNGDMQFDPKTGGLKCPYCGHESAVAMTDPDAAVVERSLDEYLSVSPERLQRLTANAMQVQCSGCGSVVEFEPPTVAGECPFCGAKIVAQPRAADPLVAPEAVLPFQITAKEARASIQKWISSRWFAPNALKQQAQQEASQGVYVPFWTYDADTYSRYRGERGEYYYETEWYTDSEGKRQSRQVRKTRWYNASGSVGHFFDDVLIPATQSIDRNKLNQLEPWGLENLRPYEPAFLSGFKAQRYQVELGQGFEEAKGVMAGHIHTLVCRDIGGDEQRVHSINTSYSDLTFKHLLLPIYISAYRYQSKVFQVVVNARTGEVQGERPYSIWKIAFAILLGLAIIAFFIYLQNNGGGR